MSSNRFVFDGLEQLKQALRDLPAELAGEAAHIVQAEANSAAQDIRAIYGEHEVTGRLRDRVRVDTIASGQFGAAWQVVSADPIAWLFDNGSQARHWAGGKSTGQMWGNTAPTHAFVRTMIAHRIRMYESLRDMVERHGLIVRGSVDRLAA